MTTLTELAAMLDAATGPSLELDEAVLLATGWKNKGPAGRNIDCPYGDVGEVWFSPVGPRYWWPNPSHSIDTALALAVWLLPDSTGNQLSWRQRDVGKPGWCGYWASLVPAGEKTGGRVEAYAPTIPLAILKALVAALIAKEQQT